MRQEIDDLPFGSAGGFSVPEPVEQPPPGPIRYGHLLPGNETEAAALLDTFLAVTGASLAQAGR